MTLSAELRTDFPFQDISKLFQAELERTHKRSDVRLNESEGTAFFMITANDVPALRAALNGVTSILSVYEKTARVIG